MIRSVSYAYSSWISNLPKFLTDKTQELPEIHFMHPVIDLDAQTVTYKDDLQKATIFTIDRRI